MIFSKHTTLSLGSPIALRSSSCDAPSEPRDSWARGVKTENADRITLLPGFAFTTSYKKYKQIITRIHYLITDNNKENMNKRFLNMFSGNHSFINNASCVLVIMILIKQLLCNMHLVILLVYLVTIDICELDTSF